jgi:hypothetical protein
MHFGDTRVQSENHCSEKLGSANCTRLGGQFHGVSPLKPAEVTREKTALHFPRLCFIT